MGAFDMLSDNDPRVLAHEEAKLHRDCGQKLSKYTIAVLRAEIHRQLKEARNAKINASIEARKKRDRDAKHKEIRYRRYIKLKKEFG